MVQNTTEINCPSCKTVYRIPDNFIETGMRQTRCSVCGLLFEVERPVSGNDDPSVGKVNQQSKRRKVNDGQRSRKQTSTKDSIDEDAEIFLTGSFAAFDPDEISAQGAEELFKITGGIEVANIDEDSIFSTSIVEVPGMDEISQMSRNEPFGIGQSAFSEVEDKPGYAPEIEFEKSEKEEKTVASDEKVIDASASLAKQGPVDQVQEPPELKEVSEQGIDELSPPEKEEIVLHEIEEKQPVDHMKEGDDQEFELLAAALDETSDDQESGSSSEAGVADIEIGEEDYESFDLDEDSITESGFSESQREISDVTDFDEVDLADVEFGVSDEEGTEEAEPEVFSIDESSAAPATFSSAVDESSTQNDVEQEKIALEDEFSLKEQFEDKYRLELDPFSKSPVKEGEIGIDDTLAKELIKLEDDIDTVAEESPRIKSEVIDSVESAKEQVGMEEVEKTPEKLPKVEKRSSKKPELRKARPTIENAIKPETISGHIYQVGVLVAGLGSYATIIFGKSPWQFDPLWSSSLMALGILGFFMQGLSGLLLAGIFTFFYPLALFSTQMDVIVDGTFSGLFVIGAQVLLSIIFMAVYFFTMGRKGDHFLPRPGVGFSLLSLLFGMLAITVGSWAHLYTISIPPLEQVLLMGFSIGNISFYSGVSLPVLIQALLLSLAIATGFTARAMRNRLIVFAYIGVVFGFLVLLLLYSSLVFGEFRIMLPV